MGYRVRDLKVGDVVSVLGYRVNEDDHATVGTVATEPSVDNAQVGDHCLIRTQRGALLALHESQDGSVVTVTKRRGTGRVTVLRDGAINYRS